MAIAIFSRIIGIKMMMRMFDRGDINSGSADMGNDFLNKRGLA
jgi:hypothetical protein